MVSVNRLNVDSYNHSPLTLVKKKTAEEFECELELAHSDVLAEESGFNYLPGISNLAFAPYATYQLSKKAKTSHKLHDHEGLADHGLRYYQTIFAFTGAVCTAVTYSQVFFKNATPKLFEVVGRYGSILGLILCFLEGVAETLGLVRQITFYNSPFMHFARFLEKSQANVDKEPHIFIKELQQELALLKDEKLSKSEWKKTENLLGKALGAEKVWQKGFYAKDLQHLASAMLAKSFAQKYFDGVNVSKVVELERRVGIWPCHGVDKKLAMLAQNALSGLPQKSRDAVKGINQVFKQLDEQTLKKMVIYAVGLCAVIFTAAALILSLGSGVGTGIIAGIFIIGFIASFIRYLVVSGVFSQDGWKFSLKACLPQFIIDKIDRQRQSNLAASAA